MRLGYAGTVGILARATREGLVPRLAPLLDRLDALGFRLSPQARATGLGLVGEAPSHRASRVLQSSRSARGVRWAGSTLEHEPGADYAAAGRIGGCTGTRLVPPGGPQRC